VAAIDANLRYKMRRWSEAWGAKVLVWRVERRTGFLDSSNKSLSISKGMWDVL